VISKQIKSFIVHSVSQGPYLRHLCEPLGGTEGLLVTVGFKKMTACVWWWTGVNTRWEWDSVSSRLRGQRRQGGLQSLHKVGDDAVYW